MTAFEYMEKQLAKHRRNYLQESARGAPEEVLHNIRLKIGYYETAVEALRDVRETGYNRRDYDSAFWCSVCGWEDWDTMTCDTEKHNYCPNCGAHIIGRIDDGN